MTIRIATLGDVNELLPLFVEYNEYLWSLLSKKESFFKKPKKNFKYYIRKSLIQMISNNKHRILVLEIDGKIVGSISGWINYHKNSLFEDSCRIGTLGYLMVIKNYRNKGLSSLLKTEIFKWFKKRKCDFIVLDVNTNNPAKNIYNKWAFKKYSEKMLIPL